MTTAEIEALKRRRRVAGISQQKLAELAGCSIATVRRIESIDLSPQMFARIDAALSSIENADDPTTKE